MEKLARDYVEAIKAELNDAIALEANFNEEALKATLATAERTLIARERIRYYLDCGESPSKVRDPVLDAAFTGKTFDRKSLEYKSLARSIKRKNLGRRLRTYFRYSPVPERAVGYVGGCIVVGAAAIDADHRELPNNFNSLLPATDGTTRALIRSIYATQGDSMPNLFENPGNTLQRTVLYAYCTRDLAPQ